MLYEEIPLETENSEDYARVCVYILDSSQEFQAGILRPMLILCPGGAYAKTSDREAEPIAMRLLAMGYHVGILRYSTAPATYPTALFELAETMKLVHTNACKWHVSRDNIFVQGSSAGGHLAACLGVYWNQPFLYEKVGVKADILKPRGLILNYPVITTKSGWTHEGSFRNLLGTRFADCIKEVSIEEQVTDHMPACFVWHTLTDQVVPVENSILLFQALRKAEVSTELHIYPVGGHGLSLGDESSSNLDKSAVCEPIQSWIRLLGVWLKGMTV